MPLPVGRHFIGTVFHQDHRAAEADEAERVLRLFDASSRRVLEDYADGVAVFQAEKCPDSGRLHVQFFIAYCDGKAHRPTRLRDDLCESGFGAPHLQVARSPMDSIRYCRKEESRVPGTAPRDVPSSGAVDRYISSLGARGDRQGRRTDLDEVKQVLDTPGDEDVVALVQRGAVPLGVFLRYHRSLGVYRDRVLRAQQRRRQRLVHVFFGDAGTGKSYAIPGAPDYRGVYFKKAGDAFFGGYAGERIIVMDDFRGNWFTFGALLQLLDSTVPCQLKLYGGEAPCQADEIYITSNVPPQDWYRDRSRAEQDALFRRISDLREFKGFYDPTKPDNGVQIKVHDDARAYGVNHYLKSNPYD